jgi:hypothetical protein
MSKIASFRIGKGITQKIPGAEYEFTRKYLELEIRMPEQFTEESFLEALTRAEYYIDNFLGAPEVEATKIPQLDTAELDALPWKTRDREPAKHGQFAWLFGPGSQSGTEKGAEKLVEAIKASKDGKLVIGDMEYTLVKDEAFIQRKPVKKGE